MANEARQLSPAGLKVERCAQSDHSGCSRNVQLVEGIQAGRGESMAEAYRILQGGFRTLPERLMLVVRTIFRRQIAAFIDRPIVARNRRSPDGGFDLPSLSDPKEIASSQERVRI